MPMTQVLTIIPLVESIRSGDAKGTKYETLANRKTMAILEENIVKKE